MRAAFTLVELLVVIAVISILAALVMPAVMRSMKHASSTDCRNNLGQIHRGLFMYMKDYSFIAPAGDGEQWKRWYIHLEVYLPDKAVVRCPARECSDVGYGVNYRFYMGPNWAGMHWPLPYLWYNVLPVGVIENTTSCVYVCDIGYMMNRTAPIREWKEDFAAQQRGFVRFPQIDAPYGSDATGGEKYYPWWVTDPWYPAARHPTWKVNCNFFDGHVDAMLIDDLVMHNFGDPMCLYDNK